MQVEEGALMAGVPAIMKRTLNPERRDQLAAIGGLYVENARQFRATLKPVKGNS
jgi:carbonic anhydrase/acetyltransferase-like protein (isoleucine patch superfamily)